MNRILFEDLDVAEKIETKENGQDALEFIKQHCLEVTRECANLILLDLNMPIMSGLDLLDELKSLGQVELICSRIAVLTSSQHFKDLKHLKDLGVKKIIEKPLTKEKILSLLEAFEQDNASFS